MSDAGDRRNDDLRRAVAAWGSPPPGRILGRGHPAGEFLEAYEWELIEEQAGYLRLEAHLPDQVRNPRGQLFGGFTPTYVDLVALLTVRAGQRREAAGREEAGPGRPRSWLATTNMRVDYFDPIVGPRFVIESRLERRRGRTCFVATRFLQGGELAVHALTTMREMPQGRPLGDA
jgi:acyl-coenzyme A thioesterase PaaI-like protein